MPEYSPSFDDRHLKVHHLKCDHEPFAAVTLRFKRAEFRKDDRDFMPFDYVWLHEYKNKKATGRKILARITHIQTGYGIPEGYVMLSIELL